MVIAYASHQNLLAIYNSLVASGAMSHITYFLESRNSVTHASMVTATTDWFVSSAPKVSIGLTSGDTIPSFGMMVADSTGSRVYDTFAGTNNLFANIDGGSQSIGKNINSHLNVLQALLSNSGLSYSMRYSTRTNEKRIMITVRIGTPYEPIGTVVIYMKAQPVA
jgi:hypothetical protein